MSVQNRLNLQSFDSYPHSQSSYKYCLNVVDSNITACIQLKQACDRQIENLTRDNFIYVFDVEKAERVCNFIELLPHTKGKWAGKNQLIKLEPCQQFLLTTLFGWVDLPRDADDEYPDGYPGGYRRFNKLYYTVGRKNTKSIMAAAIGLYMMCETNGDFAPEIFAGATNEKQAMEVFKPARLMCIKTPELVSTYGLEINASNIAQPGSGGKFEPVIGNPGDGASPSCWIVDEYHEHKTSDQVDTAKSGMGSREEPLLLIITTAGTDTSSPCYDEHIEATKMLSGLVDIDEQLLALIYTIDPDDDYKDPNVWIKANPMLGVSVATKYIIARVANAMRNASQENLVLIKNMNKWVNAKAAWLNSNDWLACGDNDLYEGDFTNDECIGAIDLSSRLDLTAFIRLYIRMIEGKRHYFVFASHFLPSKTIEKDTRENDMYLKWVKDGDLLISGEDEIDYEHIGEHVEKFLTACNIREVTYDTWKASQLAQSLEKKGALMVEYRQQVKEMTQAMKEMEGAISAGRFHHNNDPVLTWQAGNVVNKMDAKGNYYPRKERNHNKIDGMVATIMAIGRAMYDLEQEDSVYDTRGVRQL